MRGPPWPVTNEREHMQNDLTSVIRGVVADEVRKSLGRQLELLERISEYLGLTPSQAPAVSAETEAPLVTAEEVPPHLASEAVSPSREKATRRKRRVRARAAGRTARAAATNSTPGASFREGQEVRYKQGRGTFSATVTAIDPQAKSLTLERVQDGKKVVRPFEKVEAA